jgi:signal transduction histidine kinase
VSAPGRCEALTHRNARRGGCPLRRATTRWFLATLATQLVVCALVAAFVTEHGLVWFGFAAVMLLGWLGTRAIAGAALAPVRSIVRATRAIRLSRLGKRLRESGPHGEARELAQVINELLQRFQDGLARERGFVSDVAHELRTPLAAQAVIAQAALRNPTTSAREYQAVVMQMLDEARHMERFIERLLTLTRITTQALSAPLAPIDLHDAMQQTVATLKLLGDDKRQTLRVTCAPGLQALGEATMLRQALMNLVHNAILHCPAGSRIVLRAASRQGKVVVGVDDNGPGVAPALRRRLFTRFQRGQATGHERGLGLGLSIVKALMEAQGGSVHLDDKPQPGARFCLTLQALPANMPPEPSLLDVMESVPPPMAGDTEPPLPAGDAPLNALTATCGPTRDVRPRWVRRHAS